MMNDAVGLIAKCNMSMADMSGFGVLQPTREVEEIHLDEIDTFY